VRGEDNRLLGSHLLDEIPNLVFLVRIKPIRRLVEHEHRRVVQESLRETDALFETLGRVSIVCGAPGSNGRDRPPARCADALRDRPKAAHLRDETEKLLDGHLRIGGRVLREVAHHPLHRHGIDGDIMAPTIAVPAVGRRKPMITFIVVDFPAPLGRENRECHPIDFEGYAITARSAP